MNYKQLIKGILIIISYFFGANFLALIFYGLIQRNIIPNYNNFYNLLIYLIMAIIYVLVYKKSLTMDIKDYKKNYKKYIKKGANYYLKGVFIMIVSNLFLSYILNLSKSTNELANIEMFKTSPITQAIIILLLAPLIEELVFRYSFRKMSDNIRIFSYVTGIIFGGVHVISSLSNPIMILMLIPYSAMGVALGYAYKDTDNIGTSLTMHMIHNSITLVIIIIGIAGGIV